MLNHICIIQNQFVFQPLYDKCYELINWKSAENTTGHRI